MWINKKDLYVICVQLLIKNDSENEHVRWLGICGEIEYV